MADIGKIERVGLRTVWRHEAYDFTQWLQDNIDVLNEQTELNITGAEREQSAGSFSVDLVAEDEQGNSVVIENQLEKSNHDHLGKLITYVTAVDAKSAVWIVSEPRPEHVAAISWLNEVSPVAFYLFKLEAIRIGGSPPAPLLTLIVGPSGEGRKVGETKKEFAERYDVRYRFWSELLDSAKEKTSLHGSISPSKYSWVGTGVGVRGLALNYSVRQHSATVELYIDRGKGFDEENMEIFGQLRGAKEEIEKQFEGALNWEGLEGKRRISCTFEGGGYRDEESWSEIVGTLVDGMIRLEGALRPHLKTLNV